MNKNASKEKPKVIKSILKDNTSSFKQFKPFRAVSIKLYKGKGRNRNFSDISSNATTKLLKDSMQSQSTETQNLAKSNFLTSNQPSLIKSVMHKKSKSIFLNSSRINLLTNDNRIQSIARAKSKSILLNIPSKRNLLSLDQRIQAQKDEIQKEKDCNIFISNILKTQTKRKVRADNLQLTKINHQMASSFEKRTKEYALEKMRPKPFYLQTTKINQKLIRDFNMQNKGTQQDIEYSLKNSELNDDFLKAKQSLMQKNTKNCIVNFDKMKSNKEYYLGMQSEEPSYNKQLLNELYSKITEKEYLRKKKEKERRMAEKIQSKSEKYADLVLEVSTKNYGKSRNKAQPFVSEVEVNYHNLANMIELFNFQNKRLENEEMFESMNQLKERKDEENQIMLSALKHFPFPQFIKKKLKRNTVKQYIGMSGIYL